MRRLSSLALSLLLFLGSCSGQKEAARETPEMAARSYDVHVMYYPWYGTPRTDGMWHGWNIEGGAVEGGSSSRRPEGDDIASSFFPLYGCYSSNDPRILDTHMTQISSAKIGVLVVSWWGKGSFTDGAVPGIMDAAHKFGLKVAFHIEPYEGRTAAAVREAIAYLFDTYGKHPAFYRTDRFGAKPMYYINGSGLSDASEWARILKPSGGETIRGTAYDALLLGVWKDRNDGETLLGGGFDGYYNYAGAPESAYGSKRSSWHELAQFGWDNSMIFIPCISPGYDDTRIRPWNTEAVQTRDRGEYYRMMAEEIVRIDPPFVCIASFNQWSEGTQLEAARPMSIPGFTYSDYGDPNPYVYLGLTAQWITGFSR